MGFVYDNLCNLQKSPAAAVTPSAKKTTGEKRTPGEAFTRVDAEVWSKEILEGLEDNSCAYQTNYLDIYVNC